MAEARGGEVITPAQLRPISRRQVAALASSPLEAGCQRPPQGRPQPWTPLRGPKGAPGVARYTREPTDTSSLQNGRLGPGDTDSRWGESSAHSAPQTCRIGISRVISPISLLQAPRLFGQAAKVQTTGLTQVPQSAAALGNVLEMQSQAPPATLVNQNLLFHKVPGVHLRVWTPWWLRW